MPKPDGRSMNEKTIHSDLERCKRILQASYGDRFAGLVLYGSRARDEETSDSDVDLLVLLAPPFDYSEELWTIIELLYPVQLEVDFLLSALPASVDEYRSGEIQLYRNVRREGVVI
jgi:predicted nucleotidyltransferase